MDSSLIFLAASSVDRTALQLDKYLDGYATIQYTPAGGLEVGYDERFYSLLDRPHFFPAHPGVRTRFRAAPGYTHWAHRHVGFRGPLLEQWRADGIWLETPQQAPPPRDAAQWDSWFASLIDLSRRTDRWGRLRAINQLEQLLLQLADARQSGQAGDAPRGEPWLGELLSLLAALPNGCEAPDYTRLARSLGMSSSTLQRRFKKAMNTTLHAYVVRRRVDAARTLLSETDLPLKSIAGRLGYNNITFFSRQFHQNIGVSPGVYRKSRMARN
jgi:AraC-like DNA-binding protein